jgi:hypothetical protein
MKPLVREALLSFMTARKIASQSQFAKAIKLSTGYVCDVLALRRNLSPQIIERMDKAFGLTRKQIADFNHRAAVVAGWNLPPLPDDLRMPLVTPEPSLMRPRRNGERPVQVKRAPAMKKPKTRLKGRPAKKPGKAKPAKERHHPVVMTVNRVPDEASPPPAVTTVTVSARKAGKASGFTPPPQEALLADLDRE